MVLHMSEQSPVMVGITAKPEVERMAMRREGSPAIVASQCLGHAPEFVDDADRAVGLHMTNEMHASRCDRQGGREEAALGGGKPGPVLGALALRRGHALQGRRTVVVHIPLDETRTLTADVAKAAKAMAWPKGWAIPQPVQLFDLKIVFVRRRRCRVAKSAECPGFARLPRRELGRSPTLWCGPRFDAGRGCAG